VHYIFINRMWANAQRDSRRAEYGWRSVLNAAKFGLFPLLEFRAVTLPIQERRTWRTQSEFCTWQNSVTGQQSTSPGNSQTSCKLWLASGEWRRCSNAAKTRNPLKFAWVPQTRQRISAASRPMFTILWRHLGETLLFGIFFRLSICALVAKI